MALERRFTEPLQVVETPAMVGRIQRLADVRRVSKAQVVREILAGGIAAAERDAGIDPDRAETLAHSQ